MTFARPTLAAFGAGAFGALIIGLIVELMGGVCTPTTIIIRQPLLALLSIKPDPMPPPYEVLSGGSVCGDYWRSFGHTWAVLWGPIAGVLFGTGVIAARHGGPPTAQRGFAAGALAAGVPLIIATHDVTVACDNFEPRWVLSCIVLTTMGAGLGGLGGHWLRNRQ